MGIEAKKKSIENDYEPTKALRDVHAILNQPDKFATVFCEAASTQISIVDTMTGLMERALINSVSTRNHVKNIAKEAIKEAA